MKQPDRNKKDLGAVLLTTLLVMSVMAVLAVAILDDIRISVKRSANMSEYAQADWLSVAAEEFIGNYMAREMSGRNPAELNSGLITPQEIVFPIDGGLLGFNVRDSSHCLVVSTIDKNFGPQHLRRLLEYQQWSRQEATSFVSALQDWQDTDTIALPGGAEDYNYLGLDPAYRAPNRPIKAIAELRAIQGMSEDRFQALRPFLCVGDGTRTTKININTMMSSHAVLLAALLGDDEILAAEQILLDRPASGYTAEQLKLHPSVKDLQGDNLETESEFDVESVIAFQAEYVWVETQIAFQNATRSAVYEFEIDKGANGRTYRRLSSEASRPHLQEAQK